MEPFHAVTNAPGRAAHVLAIVTPLTAILCMMPLVIIERSDPANLAITAVFGLLVVGVAIGLSLKVLMHEEVFLDRGALLVKSYLFGRIREKSVRLAPDCRARVALDTRWHVTMGSNPSPRYAIRLETLEGKSYFLDDGLNASQRDRLVEDINDYLAHTDC